MSLRINHYQANSAAYEAMMALEAFVKKSGLDRDLYELIKLRVSQINGCSFCIDKHGKDMLKNGESIDRILLLTVWREVDLYSDKEKAVLELTEHLTNISEAGVPDHVYSQVRAHFDEKQYIDLIMAVNTINCWNRLGIATGMSPGCFVR
ncbi:carboxymuconolactone decarboxylase family protein [Paenibacillus sp. J2TS4]|uniref:carboxymuconolactone decarboxylase family protein n=1 Tax=Paenibacillus sp. J2TS4 TaxID=2807194 RepID=UPI001B134EB8|nr:carboxymuconolactone decarboxylase family protein [Paenibacillus sp. J2TS4]GIP32792.1 hypothetical protein J2TS4_20020 [Paenibacillus sp. J2TS4]